MKVDAGLVMSPAGSIFDPGSALTDEIGTTTPKKHNIHYAPKIGDKKTTTSTLKKPKNSAFQFNCNLNQKEFNLSSSKPTPNISKYFNTTSKKPGMKNTGNSCYFNAVVQSLVSLPTFCCDLLNEMFSHYEVKRSFYTALLNIIKITYQFLNEGQGKNLVSATDPTEAQKAVSKNYSQFDNKKQQDAHELLGSCLNLLEKELLPIIMDLKAKENSESLPLEDRSLLSCPTKRNFSFIILKEFECKGCQTQSYIKEIFRDLSLEIICSETLEKLKQSESQEILEWIKSIQKPDRMSVYELIKYHFLTEVIERKCERCNCNEAYLRKSFYSLPRVLIVHLKRFQQGISKSNKLNDRISIPKSLTIDSFCINEIQTPIPFQKSELKRFLSNPGTVINVNSDDEIDEKIKRKDPLHCTPAKKEIKDIFSNIKVDRKAVTKGEGFSENDYNSDTESLGEEDPISLEWNKLTNEIETVSRTLSQNEELESLDYRKILPSLKKQINPLDKNPHNVYQLHSTICHKGSSTSSGHYISIIKDTNSANVETDADWFCFNDSIVSNVPSYSINSEQSEIETYILFYVHQSIDKEYLGSLNRKSLL
eukprot:TRINITY_DN7810_c0_g1_i1.p1 TRINITY_DN7810_c0_g1~~TRINITY_DN7810_c0_g1_i1.p1  ORF type:complete len:620 (-),score=155.63 TRINITY_DN7810_c0_g1_i1:1145-2926(-)